MYTPIENKKLNTDQQKNFKIAIVSSTWHWDIVQHLVEGAKTTCIESGVQEQNIEYYSVAGAYELPQMVEKIARNKNVHGIIPVGCVIRGETNHYELIVQTISTAFDKIGRTHGIPVSFGVLTVENPSQAYERIGGSKGNKGEEAAIATLGLASEFERVR
ncbi:MAG: 6,7-dimethyl-8-ribityllumazine synthase [Proteobacteria bacterium]|jgi:6,7-dimethyl-8-ribityllumazine synthase|nr:6,7-dimethyl-8-ribityllumazine synthase [Pseudomonadota bacterium]